ncbi:plasmid IncI1-type surface exclusion protein ExcA [Salmonella enterica subsp. enterica serovar 4,[5],12:b:-]|nr:plasmid IncI1-type surface exclusion protein ExcA [Salmonella enterica subsp. enterica serovar 4,[5],12:b:-]
MQMAKTTSRYPSWWTFYYALRFIYFMGIPVLSIFILFGVLSITSSRYVTQEDYIYTYSCLFLLITPAAWMYLRAKTRSDKIKKVITKIKNSGFFSPDKEYEGLSFIQGIYFGVDLKKGTMLYVRIYPGNIMDVIGLDIHNFTRTVVRENCMEIHTKYVNMPMLELSIGVNSARSIANTMHVMASRGYDYPVDFPRMIQEKRKEWEQIAGMPVTEVF